MTLCKFLILHSRNFITSTLSSSYVNYFYENMYEWITCLATQGFGWSTFFFNCTLSIGRLLFQALYFMKVLLSITIFFFLFCLIVMWHLCRVQYCYLSNKCWAWEENVSAQEASGLTGFSFRAPENMPRLWNIHDHGINSETKPCTCAFLNTWNYFIVFFEVPSTESPVPEFVLKMRLYNSLFGRNTSHVKK